jgi:hypothetical protein
MLYSLKRLNYQAPQFPLAKPVHMGPCFTTIPSVPQRGDQAPAAKHQLNLLAILFTMITSLAHKLDNSLIGCFGQLPFFPYRITRASVLGVFTCSC